MKIADFNARLSTLRRFIPLIKIYSILALSVFLYLNPFHWQFLSEQVIILLIWLVILYTYKFSFRISFLLGLVFLILAALSTAIGHPGYAEKFAPYTFWLFCIGTIQKIAESFQIRKPKTDKKEAIEAVRQYILPQRSAILLVALLLPVLYIYRSWFSNRSLASGDWVYKFPENLAFTKPVAWVAENLGTFNIPFLWAYPLQYFESILRTVTSLDYAIIEKVVWFIPILLLSILSTALFIRNFGGKLVAVIFGIIFLLTNTYTILLFSGGQMLFALGFALYPLVFCLVEWSLSKNTTSLKLLAGFGVALLGFADPRIALLFLFTINLYLIYRFLSDDLSEPRILFKKYTTLLFCLYIIPASLHLYWILPTFLTNARFNISTLKPDTLSLNFNFMTLNNVFTVFQPHWPHNIFGKVSHVEPLFYLFPFIFYAAPFLLKRPVAWFFVVLSLISAFLTKGTNEPFGTVYTYLVTVLPGFELFRDPSKFYVPLILSYTLLFSLVVERLFWNLWALLRKQSNIIKYAVPWGFLLTVALLLYGLATPAFQRTMNGTLQSRTIHNSFNTYHNNLATNNDDFYRSLWIPEKSKFAFQDNSRPIISGTKIGSLEPFNGFIVDDFHTYTYLEDPAVVDMLEILGVRFLHIVDPGSFRFNNQKDLHEAEIANRQLLADLRWRNTFTERTLFDETKTFELQNPMPRFFTADKVFWVYGSSMVYSTIKTLPDVSLKGSAFIRRETISDQPLVPKELWQAQILESNYAAESGVLTFGMPRFDRVVYIFNTEILPTSTIITTAVEGMPNTKLQFLIRRFKDFTQDEEQVYGRERKYIWQPVNIIKVEGKQDMHQLFIPPSPFGFEDALLDRIIAYPVDQIPNMGQFFASHREDPIIEVMKSSTTAYTLSVREATLPYMLIFSDSFNNGWRATLHSELLLSFPVFNLVNGFIVGSSGNYTIDVFFMPQHMLAPFFYLSLILFILFFGYLLRSMVRDYKLPSLIRAVRTSTRKKR